jgi:hypothetical protein
LAAVAAAAAVSAGANETTKMREQGTQTMTRSLAFAAALAAGMVLTPAAIQPAQAAMGYERFIGDAAEPFVDAAKLVEALRKDLADGNKEAALKLLGLNAAEAMKSDDFDENFNRIQAAAAEGVTVSDAAPDRRILTLGKDLWPFPFPIVKTEDGWGFDTIAGLEEVINRRIGENELEAINAVNGYVTAQENYHQTDWDGDGVAEYARKLIASPGAYDGLYWPSAEGVPESPAGPFVSDDELADTAKDDGYYGYRFRIVEGQGEKVAGGAYDYVINGNMIAGFALVASPAAYGESGMMTFIVNQNGSVYQKDLGPDTAKRAAAITRFNPDDSWTLIDSAGAKVAAAPEAAEGG